MYENNFCDGNIFMVKKQKSNFRNFLWGSQIQNQGVPTDFIVVYQNISVGEWDVYDDYPGPRWLLAEYVPEVDMFSTFWLEDLHDPLGGSDDLRPMGSKVKLRSNFKI